MDMKSGAIYLYQCGELECDEEYTGETSRTLGKRYKEHLKEPSPIHVQSTQTGHNTTPENLNIIGREDHGLARTLKESIYIRVNNPTFHRNVGKYNLHYIWGRFLLTPLHLKLIMTVVMHTEHPLVGMLSPFQAIGICIELLGILGMF